MINMRKVLCFLLATVFAGLALPSMAASGTKSFYAIFPTFITTTSFTATYYNVTPPPGISTINSLEIVPPQNAGVTITSVVAQSGTATPFPANDGTGGWIVNNIRPGIGTGKSLAFTVGITFTGSCVNGMWGALANAGNAFPQGDPFILTSQAQLNSSCDGTLACLGDSSSGSTNTVSDGLVTLIRYPNKDGSACVPVAFDFTDFIVTNTNTIHQVWDTNSQPNSAFTYVILWKPTWANPTTGLPKPTQVAWNPSGPPQYVDARFCLGSNPPAKYGTLNAFTASTITINTTNAPAPLPPIQNPFVQFPLVIGTERLTATAGSQNGSLVTYSVLRAQGGTQQFALSLNLPVMSAPLPLDGAGNQMHMCILTQEVSIVPPEQCALAPPPTNPPPACLQVDQTLLDEGDGWVDLP